MADGTATSSHLTLKKVIGESEKALTPTPMTELPTAWMKRFFCKETNVGAKPAKTVVEASCNAELKKV